MLEIHLFGRFEILLDEHPLEIPSRPAQSLLAYLVLHPGIPHRREQLAGLLWPESDETNARRYLSQALWRLNKSLGDIYFAADKLTITFTPQPEDRLDVHLLTQPAKNAPETWMHRLKVYQGRLLPGFYEAWAWEQAEHFQALFERQAQTLLDWLVAERRWKDVLEWGEHWLRLGETPEPAYRALMHAHAGLSDQAGVAAIYRRCVTALDRDLGVEPSHETTTLYKELLSGAFKVKAAPAPVEHLLPLPAFLEQAEPPKTAQTVFVAREQVLEQLDSYLQKAFAGQGQVAFVVGEAGQGKTSLLYEFLHRVQTAYPNVLTAFGTCNGFAGQGDPYFPFREGLQMLTGDVERQWRAGQVSTTQARLIWRNLPATVEALLARGQNLIGTLIPGSSLLARAKAAGTENSVITRLERLVTRQTSMEGMQQDFLFEQTSNVLRELAEKHPLILVLDDLHWVDESSAALLFHLGRRLRESWILILWAYRPEDVAQDPHGLSHPMQGVMRELQRLYGEIEVNLDTDSRVRGHHFIEAYLDTEPNRLDGDFREAFTQHTSGHPLFTVETLRDMQVRGDLWLDESNNWVASPDLDWEGLAARVEGVIENRIGRLSAEALRLLAIASVEGDVFTAEVLAQVKQREVRILVEALSGPLTRQYHLVQEEGLLELEGDTPQRLSQYRFRHHLFQSYLYNQLGEAERAYLHEDVGTALEILYAGRTEEVAVQLARHFRESGQVVKEIRYLRQAGERAYAQYAHKEAITFFNRALELTPEADSTERFTLLLAREKVYELQGKRENQRSDLEALQELAEVLDNNRKRAEVALRLGRYHLLVNEVQLAKVDARKTIYLARSSQAIDLEADANYLLAYTIGNLDGLAASISHIEQALHFAETNGIRRVEGLCLRYLGSVAWSNQGDFSKAKSYFKRALSIAQELRDQRLEGLITHNIGGVYADYGDLAEARSYQKEALYHFRSVGFRLGESWPLNSLGYIALWQGNYEEAITYIKQSLQIADEINDPGYTERILISYGRILLRLGEYSQARKYFEQALHISRELRDRPSECIALIPLGMTSYQLGDHELARKYCQDALLIARDLGILQFQGVIQTTLGHTLLGLKRMEEAAEVYKESLSLLQELGQLHLAMEPLAGLACISLIQKNPTKALSCVEEILSCIETNTLKESETFHIYLTCYQVLQANQDPRAESLLDTAHALLMQHAGNISDERLRKSFLENVAANRTLLEEYRKLSLS